MQKQREQLLLITGYNGVYQEDYKIPTHSLWRNVEVLPPTAHGPALVRDVIMQIGARPASH